MTCGRWDVYPSSNSGTWYQDFLNGENENIAITSPELPDSIREKEIRNNLASNSNFNSRTRSKFKSGRKNIAFADYNIGGKVGTIEAFSGEEQLQGFAPFIPEEDRVLKTEIVGFSRTGDSEAKILEQIFVEEYTPGDVGTIRLVSTKPICDSCGPVIENFVNQVKETGGNIIVEVIQIQVPLP